MNTETTSSEPSAVTQNDDTAIEAALAHAMELKTRGNDAFARKDMSVSVDLYTQALEVAAPLRTVAGRKDVCTLLSHTYANRSAACVELGRYADALSDARNAIVYSATWTKAHLRAGRALSLLGRHREACDAYAHALTLEPGNTTIVALRDAEDAAACKQELSSPVAGIEHFSTIFGHVKSVRLRLATLATFWNLTDEAGRWEIFKRFLVVLAGPSAVAPLPAGTSPDDAPHPHISRFSSSALVSLPMHNYADITVPESWQAFYTALSTTTKPNVFEATWKLCNPIEQNLIIQDVQAFFAPPAAQGAAGTAANPGAMADSMGADDEEDAAVAGSARTAPRRHTANHGESVAAAARVPSSAPIPLAGPSAAGALDARPKRVYPDDDSARSGPVDAERT